MLFELSSQAHYTAASHSFVCVIDEFFFPCFEVIYSSEVVFADDGSDAFVPQFFQDFFGRFCVVFFFVLLVEGDPSVQVFCSDSLFEIF